MAVLLRRNYALIMSDKYDNNTQTHTLNVEYLLLHN